jgi:hypothetical protein
MSDSDIFLLLLIGGGLLLAAFQAGTKLAREEMVHRLLGMKQVNNRWEVREGTEMMGLKWIPSHWVYDDGKQIRRVVWLEDEWRFENGTKLEATHSALREVKGHCETAEGKQFDPARMKPVEFADALHSWASNVGKFVPLGIEAVKLGLNATQQSAIIRKYGELLEQPGPLLRKESDLPLNKKLLRIELAKALLRPELTSEMMNSLSVAFSNLEFFLQDQEFETVGAVSKFIGDPEIANYLKRANQGGVPSPEAKALAERIVNEPGDDAVWQNIVTRYGERMYQTAVLKFIASGDNNPNMAQLIATVDAEVNAASHALKQPQG